MTQEIKKNVHLPYPNTSGTLATGGGLVFLGLFDGTSRPSMTQRSMSCGRSISAPPSRRRRADNIPELKEQRNATVLYVFGL